jgi:ABC-type multidrug transport system fused ATPase/permease subunit
MERMSVQPASRDARRRTFARGRRMLRAEISLHPRPFVLAVIGAAIFALATVASSFALRFVTDHVIVPRFQDSSVGTATVVFGCALVVAIGIVKSAGVVMRRAYAGRTQWQVGATIREQVVDRYQAQPMLWHQRHGTGELVAHAGVDVDAATDVLAPLPYSTGVVVMIVVSAAWLIATDWLMGGLAVLLFPLLIGLNVVYQRRVDPPATEAQDRIGEVTSLVHESFDGIMVVKALGREAHERERLEVKAGQLRDAKIRVAMMRATFETLLDAVPALVNVTLIVVGAWRVQQGAATVGDITSFVYLFTLLVWPLRMIGFVLGDLPHSLAGWDRIQAMLAEPVLAEPRDAFGAPARGLGVDLRGVRFGYEPGRDELRGVDLQVASGRTVAVVGPTGSGKSTLLEIVAGLLAPTSGTVAVQPGEHCLVFQEPFLFADSVRDNVDLGGTATDGEVRRALELAQATAFVDELPHGLHTVVGERGVSLSGGQRQRIALARALVRRPSVLLLDDATSSLDPTTEARILTALHRELLDVTTLVVATRPSTILLADEVVFLVDGHVAGQGPHEELVATVPAYRHLVEAYERDRSAV